MLKYKGKDSKTLTVLVGIAILSRDLGKPLGWEGEEDPALDAFAHPSDQVLALLEVFGCFEPFASNDLLSAEFGKRTSADTANVLRAVRAIPEYTEVMTAGLSPDCFN